MRKVIKRALSAVFILILMAAYLPLMSENADATAYYSISSPKAGASYKVGEKVPVKFWVGVEETYTSMDAWGRPESTTYNEMPASFKVFKGDTELYSEDFTYTKAQYIETTFTPTTTGTLKLCVYGHDYGLKTNNNLQVSTTIKVKKPKPSAVKNFKPEITVDRIAKKKALITCTANYGFGMKVYRATSKNGKYKLIKTTSKSTFTDSKLSASKVYYYRVKVYAKSGKKTYLSKWSAKTAAEKYFAGLSLSRTPSGVRVKWKSVKGTGYYLVRRSTKGIPAEEDVLSCEGKETTVYTDNEAKKGQAYYYSVTAYKDGDESVLKVYKAKIAG